jgi:cell division protein FtsL
MGTWIVLLAICLIELFAYTWFRVQHVRTGYEIGKITARTQRLNEERNQLTAEMAELKSRARITKIANELGLKQPEPAQVHVIP